jgi:hypothetical protein
MNTPKFKVGMLVRTEYESWGTIERVYEYEGVWWYELVGDLYPIRYEESNLRAPTQEEIHGR